MKHERVTEQKLKIVKKCHWKLDHEEIYRCLSHPTLFPSIEGTMGVMTLMMFDVRAAVKIEHIEMPGSTRG